MPRPQGGSAGALAATTPASHAMPSATRLGRWSGQASAPAPRAIIDVALCYGLAFSRPTTALRATNTVSDQWTRVTTAWTGVTVLSKDSRTTAYASLKSASSPARSGPPVAQLIRVETCRVLVARLLRVASQQGHLHPRKLQVSMLVALKDFFPKPHAVRRGGRPAAACLSMLVCACTASQWAGGGLVRAARADSAIQFCSSRKPLPERGFEACSHAASDSPQRGPGAAFKHVRCAHGHPPHPPCR